MLQVNDLRLSLEGGLEELRAKTAALLGVAPEQLQDLRLVRQSIDARKKSDVHYVCAVRCTLPSDLERKLPARVKGKVVSVTPQPCLLYTAPSPGDAKTERMPSSEWTKV
ncbi:MAG: hypothetical protein K1W04_03225, partial [Oscillospiraceae bacterium]